MICGLKVVFVIVDKDHRVDEEEKQPTVVMISNCCTCIESHGVD